MPLVLSSFSFSVSSVNRLLPPSMTRSPLSSRSASFTTVSRVGAPCGTMIHTTRGASSFLTMSASERASETVLLRS